MPFSLMNKKSKKSLPKIKAPIRRARLFDDSTTTKRKPQAVLKQVCIDLDGVLSTLMVDGNWCIGIEREEIWCALINFLHNLERESRTESRQFLQQTQQSEKLNRENEILKRRNDILIDLANTKTDEIDNMEKELRELRRIVKKCAPKVCKGE